MASAPQVLLTEVHILVAAFATSVIIAGRFSFTSNLLPVLLQMLTLEKATFCLLFVTISVDIISIISSISTDQKNS